MVAQINRSVTIVVAATIRRPWPTQRRCRKRRSGGDPLAITPRAYSGPNRHLASVVCSANAARATMLNSANKEVPKYHADTLAVMGKLTRIV